MSRGKGRGPRGTPTPDDEVPRGERVTVETPSPPRRGTRIPDDSRGTTQGPGAPDPRPPAKRPFGRRALEDLGLMAGAFAGATLLAELLGAENLGIALSLGLLAFAIALMVAMLRP